MKGLWNVLLHWLGIRCGMTPIREDGEPRVLIRCPVCAEKWVKPEVLEAMRIRGEL